ncbi:MULTISPECIES: ribonuclease E activity regulator RraA [Maribacter]|uniref:ribonuclease E activity regulator RraA n=1 Tax=Maribacter TaxID=252356 RepID=UPI0030DCEECA|tara:strand:- start:2440 stop:2919 length:480 start_codon:yes stop_codon:yes gene_type:complete
MFTTADLCDKHPDLLLCCDSIFQSFGNKKKFFGKIVTIRLFEDNSLVRLQLETDGNGKVLIINGGGSLRCALIGDQLAALSIRNNWSGIIINGCIRDSDLINTMDIGIRALATCPVKSIKRNIGEKDIPVKFGGVTFIPNQFVYVDVDGIILSQKNLLY